MTVQAQPLPMPFRMHLHVSRVSAALCALALCCLLAGCKLARPQNPVASADSTAVARALALSAVPRLAPGTFAELRIDADRIGGAFEATFERELGPAVTYARGPGKPSSFVAVIVDSLAMALDSATAVVRDTSETSATVLRVRLIPRAEGGWRVVSQEVLRHIDIPERAPIPIAPTKAGGSRATRKNR